MRLGAWCYWIEDERPVSGPATVRIKQGKFFRQDGEQFAVLVPGESSGLFGAVPAQESFAVRLLPARVVLFAERDDVESYAIGRAVRLVSNFQYPTAQVINPAGAVIFTQQAGQSAPGMSAPRTGV